MSFSLRFLFHHSAATLWPTLSATENAREAEPVESAAFDRRAAMRGPGESYSDVIVRLVEIEAKGRRGYARIRVGEKALSAARRPLPNIPTSKELKKCVRAA